MNRSIGCPRGAKVGFDPPNIHALENARLESNCHVPINVYSFNRIRAIPSFPQFSTVMPLFQKLSPLFVVKRAASRVRSQEIVVHAQLSFRPYI